MIYVLNVGKNKQQKLIIKISCIATSSYHWHYEHAEALHLLQLSQISFWILYREIHLHQVLINLHIFF
jgi:hypothetical protein